MQTTTLMLDIKDHEISALLMLCRSDHRGTLAQLCDSPEQASALCSALDEIAWQLASSGHEAAIAALSTLAPG